MQSQHCYRSRGFTLIELSIVLVIIALIVGGVLAGREMIEAAKLRSLMGQIEQYKTAVNTFKGKYNCLPGDCATASSFGLGSDGNGDTQISEVAQFWKHLSAAGLVAGDYSGTNSGSTGMYGDSIIYKIGTDVPISQYKNHLGVFVYHMTPGPWSTWPSMSGNIFAIENSIFGNYEYSMFPRSEAFMIDQKFDDGRIALGTIQGQSNSSGGNGYCSTTTSPITAEWQPDLNVSGLARCPLYITSGF